MRNKNLTLSKLSVPSLEIHFFRLIFKIRLIKRQTNHIVFFSIFKGASLVGRIASWLAAIWTSMHSVIALLYVGMLSFKSVPFRECNKAVTINQQSIHVSHVAVVSVRGHASCNWISSYFWFFLFFVSWFELYRTATMWNPIADRNVWSECH